MRFLILIFTILVGIYGRLEATWAEKTLNNMTVQEKIGQLFMVPACPNYESETLLKVIKQYHIGSILIKHAHPLDQIPFMNTLQNHSLLPILCAGDAEWGLGMRMEETLSFPKNLTLGAIEDDRLLYDFGKAVGNQCQLVGIHLNFAPVVDVNSNPQNPVIGMRSFGSSPQKVGAQASQVLQGMQDAGILACVKHFPGHGEATMDSHEDLPMVLHTKQELKAIEFIPFKQAFSQGVQAVMSAHLLVPALDPKSPASLSYPIITELLQQTWGFQGLIISDALNMKALTKNYSTEEIALKALLAGHDLLLYGAHLYDDVEHILKDLIPQAFTSIEKGVKSGVISEETIDKHVLKILKVKERLGLHQNRYLHLPENLMDELHSLKACNLRNRLFQASVTVLNPRFIPVSRESVSYIRLWEEEVVVEGETLVIGVNHSDQVSRLKEICAKHPRVIVALFASPYLLKDIPAVPTVIGYEWCESSEKAVWDVIIGKEKEKGELSIRAPILSD